MGYGRRVRRLIEQHEILGFYSFSKLLRLAIYSSQDMGITSVSTSGWMDKEKVVSTHSEILFSLKKEGKPAICNNTEEPRGHYVKWNKPVKKR